MQDTAKAYKKVLTGEDKKNYDKNFDRIFNNERQFIRIKENSIKEKK